MKDYMDEARELFRNEAWVAGGIFGLIPYVAAFGRRCREDGLEEAAVACDSFAVEAVGNVRLSGTRDPFLYEQGIGAERCASAIRALKGGGNG